MHPLPLCITCCRIAVSLFLTLFEQTVIISTALNSLLSRGRGVNIYLVFVFDSRKMVADVRRPSASILIRWTNFTRIDSLTQSRDKRYMHGWFDWLNLHFRRALNNNFCSVCVPIHILIWGRDDRPDGCLLSGIKSGCCAVKTVLLVRICECNHHWSIKLALIVILTPFLLVVVFNARIYPPAISLCSCTQ